MNEKRNWKIYFEWIEGQEYIQLAQKYHLSKDTIKEICVSKVPASVKKQPWQAASSYKKYREWKRNHLQGKQSSM